MLTGYVVTANMSALICDECSADLDLCVGALAFGNRDDDYDLCSDCYVAHGGGPFLPRAARRAVHHGLCTLLRSQ